MSDVQIKPANLSLIPDTGEATKFGPNWWNASRIVSGGNAGDLLTRDPASATGGSWVAPADLSTVVRTSNTYTDPGWLLALAGSKIIGAVPSAIVLATPRTINGVAFDGSANITVPAGTVTKADVGLALVENTALSTWAGSTNLTTLGPLTTLKVGGATAPNGVEGYFASASASDPRGLMSAQYTTDAIGARFHLRKGRGTEAAPTTLVTGDVLGRIRFSGYDSANYLQSGSIDVVSTGTIAATRVPTYMTFSVATDAAPSVLTEVLRLTATGITLGAPLVGAMVTSVNDIAATSTDGLVLQNTTLATAGVPLQQAPRFRLRSHVWNTSTPADNTDDWWIESTPFSGGPPAGILKLFNSANGAAALNPLTINSTGGFTLPNTGGLTFTSRLVFGAGSSTGLFKLRNAGLTAGVVLDVATDAILKVRPTSESGYATVDALGYKASGVAGVSFGPAHPASITIVNGIVTACS